MVTIDHIEKSQVADRSVVSLSMTLSVLEKLDAMGSILLEDLRTYILVSFEKNRSNYPR